MHFSYILPERLLTQQTEKKKDAYIVEFDKNKISNQVGEDNYNKNPDLYIS